MDGLVHHPLPTNKQTNKQTNKKEKQTNKQTNKQTERSQLVYNAVGLEKVSGVGGCDQ
jgi:hypothetical protein